MEDSLERVHTTSEYTVSDKETRETEETEAVIHTEEAAEEVKKLQ